MSAQEINVTIEKLNAAFAAFKDANNERLLQIEKKGTEDAVTAEKVARIDGVVADCQKAVNDLNLRLSQSQFAPVHDGSKVTPAMAEYKSAFRDYFTKGIGESGLRDLAIKAGMTVQTDPSGGYLVPPDTASELDRIQATVSSMRGLATVVTTSSNAYRKMVNIGGAASGWVAETEARPETTSPVLSALEFPVMELYANPAISQALLDDAGMNLEQWIGDEVTTLFAEQEGAAFITGNGVGRPRGVVAADTVANASWSWGKLGFIKTGVNGAFAATNPADNLIDLLSAVKQSYRANGSFLLNRNVAATVRKFKDGQGQYLWQPSLQAGQPATFSGYPVVDDDNMPDAATGSFSVAFGDFRRGYLIVDRIGIRILRDPFTAKPNVMFYTTKRVGGGIQNYEAIKLLQFSA